jgi:LPS O-antigen subunit length determinant protein (WzzB/FepE family)
VTKVSRNIEYLQEQIGKTSISEMQGVFYSIIEEQIKNKMLAEASPDYAFLVVGPSMVPEEKSKPKRALMFVSGTLVGFLLSVFLVLVLHYAQKGNSDVR